MPQLFGRTANTLARVSLLGGVLLVAGGILLAYGIQTSNYVTDVELIKHQPVPFTHQHHVSGLGIDCRYCHTSVEDSSFAGIPPVSTCMNCHSQIFSNSPFLEPVRASFRTGTSIQW